MDQLVTVRVKIDGCVTGKIGRLEFEAKVLSEASPRGIDGGRVSRLLILNGEETVAKFDRGWSVNPEEKSVHASYLRIKESLEHLPV